MRGSEASIFIASPAVAHQRKHRCDPAFGYNFIAGDYDQWIWQKIWQLVEWPAIESFVAKLSLKNAKLLDIGVGTGKYIEKLNLLCNDFELFGIDISPRMVERAKARGSKFATIEQGDVSALSFQDNFFDIILLCRVGSHLENLDKAFGEVHRTLKPGGIFVYTDIHASHKYKCTAIPVGRDGPEKIEIKTYKHRLGDVKKCMKKNGIIIDSVKIIATSDIINTKLDDLPKSIDLLDGNKPVSFIIFSRN